MNIWKLKLKTTCKYYLQLLQGKYLGIHLKICTGPICWKLQNANGRNQKKTINGEMKLDHGQEEPTYWRYCNWMRLVLKPSSAAHCSRPTLKRQVLVESYCLQEASSLGRWWTNVPRPSPSSQLGDGDFKGIVKDGAAGYMVTSCIIRRLAGIKVRSQASLVFCF